MAPIRGRNAPLGRRRQKFYCPHQGCDYFNARLNLWSRHQRTIHGSVLLRCIHCESEAKEGDETSETPPPEFPDLSSFGAHVRQNHVSIGLRCPVCVVVVMCQADLDAHVTQRHAGISAQDGLYHCPKADCCFTSRHRRDWQRHKTSCDPIGCRETCDHCGHVLASQQSLANHIAAMHGERNWPCPVCEKAFPSRSALVRHQPTHLVGRGRPYACDLCQGCFVSKEALAQHYRETHMRAAPENCAVAPAYQAALDDLNARRYYEKRPKLSDDELANQQVCEKCGADFRKAKALERHTRTSHLDNTCSTCGVEFETVSWRYQHESVCKTTPDYLLLRAAETTATAGIEELEPPQPEKPPKPHTCDRCGAGFTARSSLKKHCRKLHGVDLQLQRAHLGEEDDEDLDLARRRCAACGAFFESLDALEIHRKEVHESTICPTCQKTFSSVAVRKWHQKRYHDPPKSKND